MVATCITREKRIAAGTPKRAGIDRRPCALSKSTSWHAYRMSKPPTHKPMARPSSHGAAPLRPPAAIQPPTGATAMASPRNICVYGVTRLASEYQKTMASAIGDRTAHSVLRRDAPSTNTIDDTATKTAASVMVMAPRGSSRIAVRGFNASNLASTNRLNPIAALRALTMQTTIHPTWLQENGWSRHASSAPVSANGSANTEWLKRMKERYVANLRMAPSQPSNRPTVQLPNFCRMIHAVRTITRWEL